MSQTHSTSDTILKVEDLRTYFHTRNGVVKAVDGISFDLKRGETLGIVGESGSGKSVSCYTLLGLIPCPPGKVESGRALFHNTDLLNCSKSELQAIRGNKISMIFQDPMTCLNPYLTVGFQLMEPLLLHKGLNKVEATARVLQAFQEVGIQDGASRLKQYPHEFSGGMRQRVMIAMALITEPELLIADEPTTALDVTVQAQILDLIRKLQKEKETAVIFVTHDLGAIAGLADRVMVMYAGKVCEMGSTHEVFKGTKHPYTRALLDSIPGSHEAGEELYTIPGLPPDVSKPLPGCAFSARCEFAVDRCLTDVPGLTVIAQAHKSACLRVKEGIL